LTRLQAIYRRFADPAAVDEYRRDLAERQGLDEEDLADYDPRADLAAMFWRFSRRPDGTVPSGAELLEAVIGPSPRSNGRRNPPGTLYTGFPELDDPA
jgi:hypothetical protein